NRFMERGILTALTLGVALLLFSGCRHPRPAETVPSRPAVTNVVAAPPPPSPKPVAPERPLPALSSADTMSTNVVVWDSKAKKHAGPATAERVDFSFSFTNISSAELVIYATETTCECTVAKMPSVPWVIPPGGHGEIG